MDIQRQNKKTKTTKPQSKPHTSYKDSKMSHRIKCKIINQYKMGENIWILGLGKDLDLVSKHSHKEKKK